MLTSMDVKFIFDSARLGFFSSANILQIADASLRVVFLLFLPCFLLLFCLVLTLKRSEMSTIFLSQPKQLNLVPRPSLVKHKILPNLVISNWLWWIMRVLLASQNWGNILNE